MFTHSRFAEGGLNFFNWSLGTLTMTLARYFVTRKMGPAKIYRYIKFEVSSFTHSRFIEEGLKFKILPLLGVFCHG